MTQRRLAAQSLAAPGGPLSAIEPLLKDVFGQAELLHQEEMRQDMIYDRNKYIYIIYTFILIYIIY